METKTLGKYVWNKKTTPNPDDLNTNLFVFTISNNLRDLIKTAVIEGTTDYSLRSEGNYIERKRYLVRRVINNCLYENYKDVLFDTELVDTGKLHLTFGNLDDRDRVLNALQTTIKELVKATNRELMDETVTLTVRREE